MEELKNRIDDASLDFLFGEALPRVWAKDEESQEKKKSLEQYFYEERKEVDYFSPELKAYWMEQGYSEDVVNKYADEFYLIEWMFDHVNFQEEFKDYEEDCIKYFLDEGHTEEAVTEYFSVNWKMDASEIRAIINKVKATSPYTEEERKEWDEAIYG